MSEINEEKSENQEEAVSSIPNGNGKDAEKLGEDKVTDLDSGEEGKKKEKDSEKSSDSTMENKIKALEEKVAKLQKEKEKLQRESKEIKESCLLKLADTENYKKRLTREHEESIKFANEGMLKDFIVVLDHFNKAIDAAEKTTNMESMLEGIKLTFAELREAMRKNGVEDIPAVGEQFDPNLHEAVARVPSEHEENRIVEEYRKGYMLNKRVLVAPMVAVSSGKPKSEESEEAEKVDS